jgi:hypothetical protein
MSAPPFAVIVPEFHTGRDNERQTKDKKRKAPTRKNPHERLTIKGLLIGSKTKISRFGLQGKGFGKTSANKTKSPTLPTKHPAWNAGLRQSRGFLLENFFNTFQPVAYRRPAVMRLYCNVRQRKPLNVPQ